MIVTPGLWRRLAHPPNESKLYQRVLLRQTEPGWVRRAAQEIAPIVAFLYLFAIMTVCCMTVSRSPNFLLWLGGALVIIFNGTFYGAQASLRIASELSAERSLLELMRLLPGGSAAMLWAVWCGCLYRANKFNSHYQRHIAVLRGFMWLIIAVTVITLIDGRTQYTFDLLLLYGYLGAGLIASYVDFVHSLVLGCLVGTAASGAGRVTFEAQIWGVILFLSVHFATYALTALIGFVILPRLFALVFENRLMMEGLLLLARLAVFLLLREASIIVTSRIVDRQYE